MIATIAVAAYTHVTLQLMGSSPQLEGVKLLTSPGKSKLMDAQQKLPHPPRKGDKNKPSSFLLRSFMKLWRAQRGWLAGVPRVQQQLVAYAKV